jgi:hypothetical protein
MDGQASGHTNAGDIWGLDGMSAPVYNVIIDHVTAKAATDGIFDVYGEVHDVTLSWNLITDTVTALHLSTADIDQSRDRISIHHNVFARNNERQVRLRHHNDLIDFRNNVIYGWGWFEAGAYGLHIQHDPGETNTSANVVGNVFHYVPGLSGDEDDAIQFMRGPDEGTVFFRDNVVPTGETDDQSSGAEQTVPAAAQVTLHAAARLHEELLPFVGTHHATTEEQQLITEIQAAITP